MPEDTPLTEAGIGAAGPGPVVPTLWLQGSCDRKAEHVLVQRQLAAAGDSYFPRLRASVQGDVERAGGSLRSDEFSF